LETKIAITSFSSFSPLGDNAAQIWENYLNPKTLIKLKKVGKNNVLIASISLELKRKVTALKKSDSKYKSLDDTVLFSILASRQAVKTANWNSNDIFGINIGSSRGATKLFEKHHSEFLKTGISQTLSSPTTTLGNISSWVSHDLQSNGPEISHSITCSTALHSLLNGIAWLKSGMATKFLVGGSEAPLTAFTIAQMQSLKIYASNQDEYPCKASDLSKKNNTMVIGEGAAVICLDINQTQKALAYITGIGYATEVLEHNISISTEAECFKKSIKMALGNMHPSEIDVIITHTPGTIKGDKSELRAIQKVFQNNMPLLTNNKWKIGHTFGTSGMLSVEMAILMLQHNTFIHLPFNNHKKQTKDLKNIMVNAVGFGGNAVSVVISI